MGTGETSGKSGCLDRVKSTALGKEDCFLQTHGVTLTLPLRHSGTAMVMWLVDHKTKVTITVTGENHREPRGQVVITGACLCRVVLPARRCAHWAPAWWYSQRTEKQELMGISELIPTALGPGRSPHPVELEDSVGTLGTAAGLLPQGCSLPPQTALLLAVCWNNLCLWDDFEAATFLVSLPGPMERPVSN